MLDKSSLRKILVGKIRLGERGRLCTPPRHMKYILGIEYLHSTWVPDAASFSSS